MARIRDLWHKARPDGGEPRCAEHNKVPTLRHGRGDARWLACWQDGGRERARAFVRRGEAEWFLAHLSGIFCLVYRCGKSAVTEPPVLLCADHRDMIVQQVTRRRPKVHEPVVYFIRNGSRVKIGWTTNLRKRLESLSLPPSAVELLIPGGPAEEDMLHRRFRRTRVGRSEWFERCEAIDAYIAQNQPKPGAFPDRLLTQIRGEREEAA